MKRIYKENLKIKNYQFQVPGAGGNRCYYTLMITDQLRAHFSVLALIKFSDLYFQGYFKLLAPTGALVVMMVYYMYIYPATFSDFHSVP